MLKIWLWLEGLWPFSVLPQITHYCHECREANKHLSIAKSTEIRHILHILHHH